MSLPARSAAFDTGERVAEAWKEAMVIHVVPLASHRLTFGSGSWLTPNRPLFERMQVASASSGMRHRWTEPCWDATLYGTSPRSGDDFFAVSDA